MEDIDILCNKINEIAKNFKGDKEIISDELAEEAYSYIRLIRLNLPGDYLLFLVSMNLINSYVKEESAKLGYNFKKELEYLLKKSIERIDNLIRFNKDEGLYIVEIRNLQFSFHYAKLDEDVSNNFDSSLKWDGIRKQPCALTIYNLVKNSNINRTNIDLV